MDSRSLKKLREVSSSIRDKVEENSKIVHYWSFTSEFSTKHLKKFADEVPTVLGENKVLLQPSDHLTVVVNKNMIFCPLKNRGKGDQGKGKVKKGEVGRNKVKRKQRTELFF